MGLIRREFLKFSILAGALAKSYGSKGSDETNEKGNEDLNFVTVPQGLKKGSKVAITAPASSTSMGEITRGMKIFKNLGCDVVVGDTIKKYNSSTRYLSAPDEVRAKELMEFYEDEQINCIIAARGGYGSLRLLPLLDFEIIRKNPKILIGFSDISALINAVFRKTRTISFHGPVASSNFDSFTYENLKNAIMFNKDFKKLVNKFPSMSVINEGTAQGRLVGGNLTVITSTLGTEYEIETEGTILFLEEISEHPYKIDRMLTQLWLAEKLQKASAIIFGYFHSIDSRRNFYPGYSFTIRQVIESRIKPLGIPSVLGLPIGHNSKMLLTLPIGTLAEINTKNKTLTLLEPSVC
ncbi:MAG: LD-carboxypeptidase [Candidatus Kapabacteria bacterium]|nr:LD-carboxypeptidase [Candidatus Kapabacteria bacterium]